MTPFQKNPVTIEPPKGKLAVQAAHAAVEAALKYESESVQRLYVDKGKDNKKINSIIEKAKVLRGASLLGKYRSLSQYMM